MATPGFHPFNDRGQLRVGELQRLADEFTHRQQYMPSGPSLVSPGGEIIPLPHTAPAANQIIPVVTSPPVTPPGPSGPFLVIFNNYLYVWNNTLNQWLVLGNLLVTTADGSSVTNNCIELEAMNDAGKAAYNRLYSVNAGAGVAQWHWQGQYAYLAGTGLIGSAPDYVFIAGTGITLALAKVPRVLSPTGQDALQLTINATPATIPSSFSGLHKVIVSVVGANLAVTLDGNTVNTPLPASTSMTVTLDALVAGGFVSCVLYQRTVAYSGGSVSQPKFAVGYSGAAGATPSNTTEYTNGANIDLTVTETSGVTVTSFPAGAGQSPECKNNVNPWNITTTITSVSGNLNGLTTGTFNVWLQLATLP